MTLSLSASVRFSGLPTVKLVGLSTTGSPNPIPDNTLIDVWRNHADGTRHRVLIEQGARLLGGGWAWLDVHCPYNQRIVYDITAAGFTASTPPVFLPSKQTWLIPASTPELAVRVEKIVEFGDRATGSRAARFEPVGGAAVFLTDGYRDGVTGSMTLRTTDERPYRALFADDGIILVNTPGLKGWDVQWMWVQPGDVKYSDPVGSIHYGKRLVTIPFEESADPDVDLTPQWTLQDVADTYATFDDVTAAYGTFLDLVTDTRL